MRLLVLTIASLLLTGPSLSAKDCEFQIHKHERHTTQKQKKEAYRLAGIPWEKRACCVVDHIVPLELGGLDEISNMQIQVKSEGRDKDKVENYLARRVCAGTLSLPEAQEIVRHWKTVRVAE